VTHRAAFRLGLTAICALLVAAPASGQATKYGGTITISQGVSPNGLDPTIVTESDPGFRRIVPNYCLPLYTFASNHGTLELDPILAAAPPVVSADKLTYTIQLRQGIQFNDGTPFNAQAVVSSFQRYATFSTSARVNDFLGVERATASGPYTVVYHLTQRNSAFTGNMYPLSPTAIAKEGAGFATDPICVGPFMVENWNPGVSTTLVKSPYYYKRGAIHLDRIVYEVLPNIQTALNALQAGDVQVVQDSSIAPPTGPNIKSIRGVQLGWAGAVTNFRNRSSNPLAQSAKLRQAFEEAIDRSTDSKVAYQGVSEPSCTLIPAENSEWYAQTKVPCTPYDPTDARRLVAQSGFPLPISVHLVFLNSVGNLAEAQVIQSEEAAAGFDVTIDPRDSAGYNAVAAAGQFDVLVRGVQPDDPDPNSYIYDYYDSAGQHNISGYSNPRLDYVLANALKATDPKARATDYRVAQQIIHADRPVIVIRESVSYGIFDSGLTGIEFNPFGVLLFANAQYTQ
jgi:peptide/nickel transport system substrate-binding protein